MAGKEKQVNPRLGQVGGAAVIEGVMMRSKNKYSVAVRMPEGDIRVHTGDFTSIRKKVKVFNIPVIRGFVNMVESLILSYKAMMISSEAFGLDGEEEESKFEKWLREKFGKSLVDVVMVIGVVLGLALGIGIFFFLPNYAAGGIGGLIARLTGSQVHPVVEAILEGLIKIAIFIGYIALVSLMKDIRRTFEYHGAEHKSIFCYEAGEELTPSNVKKFKRFHPRCGTSFIFVLLIIGILFSIPLKFLPVSSNRFLYSALKFLVLPLIVGVGFEFIAYAGKHDNLLVRVLSAPGLWIQRLTTREPDEEEIECAIKALKTAMPDVFPEEIPQENGKDGTAGENASSPEGEKGPEIPR